MSMVSVNNLVVAWSICLVSFACARKGSDSGLSTTDGGFPGNSRADRPSVGAIAGTREDSLRAFFVELEDAMVPLRDSLESRFASIRRLPRRRSRDSAIEVLGSSWGEVEIAGMPSLLTRNEFHSIMSPESSERVDSVSVGRLRRTLATGGLALDYQEGFGIVPDLGGRPDLLASTASPSLAERLRLAHQGIPTVVFNDAGIVSPLDTVVGRIQGWEAFARRFAGTSDASFARKTARWYMTILVCGDQNSPSFEGNRPDPEFLLAWRRLSKGPDGASRRWIREWLELLSSEKRRLTPRVRDWLARRGMTPSVGSDPEP